MIIQIICTWPSLLEDPLEPSNLPFQQNLSCLLPTFQQKSLAGMQVNFIHTHTHTDFKISHLYFLLFWSRLLNIENHPIFLSPLQRLSYRVIAHTILYFGKSKKSFVLALNKKLGKCKWKHNVKKFHMVLNRYKTLRNLSSKQRKIFQYKQSAISYMRFCRNVVVHLKDNNFNRDVSPQTLLRTKFSKRIKLFFFKFYFKNLFIGEIARE